MTTITSAPVGPLLDRLFREASALAPLAESLRAELTRMGVTKPMRFDPGAKAGGAGASGPKA